jgi:hypothetical protein
VNRIKSSALALVAAGLFVGGTTAPTFAAPHSATHHHPAAARPAGKGKLTVTVTTSGAFSWGTIKVGYKKDQCGFSSKKYAKPKCKFSIPKGKYTASEKAIDSVRWPFAGWKWNGKMVSKKKKYKYTLGSKGTLAAVYKEKK